MILKILKNKKGTALLVALLVMGVLLAISLALSSLILREIRITAETLDAGKAYYAAESGVEVALYNIKNNLPGWEPGGYAPLELSADVVAEYTVANQCSAYPCFGEGYDEGSIGTADLRAYYDVLDLNESITLPLFVVDENGAEVPVRDFVVEFFALFDPNTDLRVSLPGGMLSGWDILRWKIFGINNGRTESISDFTALSMLNSPETDESFSTNAQKPSWFGTVSCNNKTGNTGGIECASYLNEDTEILYDPQQESPIYAGVCDNTQAREHYLYGGDTNLDMVDDCYPIGQFLTGHDLNYLTLTNLMNPAVFKDTFDVDELEAKSKIYFRVELFDDKTVREYADITANGYSGDSKQSINVQLQRDSFMPVFHFSLYSTYDSGN